LSHNFEQKKKGTCITVQQPPQASANINAFDYTSEVNKFILLDANLIHYFAKYKVNHLKVVLIVPTLTGYCDIYPQNSIACTTNMGKKQLHNRILRYISTKFNCPHNKYGKKQLRKLNIEYSKLLI